MDNYKYNGCHQQADIDRSALPLLLYIGFHADSLNFFAFGVASVFSRSSLNAENPSCTNANLLNNVLRRIRSGLTSWQISA